MARATRRLLLVATGIACAACGAADTSNDEPSAGSTYVAIIRHLDIPGPDDAGERTIVYVADMNNEPLSLDDQIEVIGVLDPDVDVRFVDDIEAAAETDDGSFASPDDGWLVAIGTPVEEDGSDTIAMRVEASEPDDEPTAWQLRLELGDDVTVVESLELDPELLVPPVSP